MAENRVDYCIRAVRPGAQSVIDIGCGLGEVLSALTSVPERVGVDTDAELIHRAQARDADVKFMLIGGDGLPFGEGRFDVAILSEVLEHVGNANKVAVVSEALRVLRPGGDLIVTSPHRGPFSRFDPLDYKRSMPRLYGRIMGDRDPKTPRDVGHVPLTFSEVEALLQGQADIVELEYGGPVSPLIANVMSVLFLAGASEAAKYRWAAVQGKEAGVRAPSWCAHVFRLIARKRS